MFRFQCNFSLSYYDNIYMKRTHNTKHKYIPLIIAFLLLLCLFSVSYSERSRSPLANYRILEKGIIVASAYNSLPNQTDDTPWITASGTRCHEGVIASNYFPIGTKLMIEGYQGRVFVVEDRMNKRYNKRLDIWFRDYDNAVKFGVRKVKYYVIASA